MTTGATSNVQSHDTDELNIASAQVGFGHLLWTRDYGRAAKLEPSLDEVFRVSSSAGAWTALWLGYPFELMGDVANARTVYRRSHNAAKNIPPFEVQAQTAVQHYYYSEQICDVARYLDCGSQPLNQILRRFEADLSPLKAPGSTVPQIEEAIRSPGEYLGLNATRPEKEYGTGPDVLWLVQNGVAFCMEVKSDKTSSQHYGKKMLARYPTTFNG